MFENCLYIIPLDIKIWKNSWKLIAKQNFFFSFRCNRFADLLNKPFHFAVSATLFIHCLIFIDLRCSSTSSNRLLQDIPLVILPLGNYLCIIFAARLSGIISKCSSQFSPCALPISSSTFHVPLLQWLGCIIFLNKLRSKILNELPSPLWLPGVITIHQLFVWIEPLISTTNICLYFLTDVGI